MVVVAYIRTYATDVRPQICTWLLHTYTHMQMVQMVHDLQNHGVNGNGGI